MTTDPRNVNRTRSALAAFFDQQAEWRARKADEYPEDDRNQQSATALHELAEHVLRLPVDDPRLVSLSALDNTPDDFFCAGEEASSITSRYGFRRSQEEPDRWLNDFLDACVRDALENTGSESVPWEVDLDEP